MLTRNEKRWDRELGSRRDCARMSCVESGQLALLETLSSAISCRWDLGYLAFVSLSFHICKVGANTIYSNHC